jgi:hypothetical protein
MKSANRYKEDTMKSFNRYAAFSLRAILAAAVVMSGMIRPPSPPNNRRQARYSSGKRQAPKAPTSSLCSASAQTSSRGQMSAAYFARLIKGRVGRRSMWA